MPEPGIPGAFVGFFIVAALIGLGTLAYRISVARDIARRAGLDPNDATATALLSDNGLDATYLAAALRDKQQRAPLSRSRTTQERLTELAGLRDQGLISPEEYDEHRKSILGQI